MPKVTIDKVIPKHFVETKNGEVEVKKSTGIDQYGKDVVVYENKLSKGKRAGESEYWVAVKDFIGSTRTSKADSILADVMAGMSAKEIKAKYDKPVQ